MKKFVSVLLALVMTLALSVTALAAPATNGSITIDNAIEGQTYTIYELLYLESYNKDAGAYSYKATNEWKTFIESADVEGKYMHTDDQGYVTWVAADSAAADFAKLAQAYAAKNGIAHKGTVKATGTTVKFENLELGYYLVDSTLGTLCALDTTNSAVTMKEKNAEPTNVKEVQEDANSAWGNKNDADIGQTVNFKSTITAQAGAENYVFHDKMSAGLTFGSVTGVTLNGKTVDAANYTVKTSGFAENHDCTFEVIFIQAFCDTLKASDQIVISYTAVVNEKAVIGSDGNPNESKVEYGESGKTTTTPPSTTTTYTWKVDVLKYAEVTPEGSSATEEKPLSGAVFILSKNNKGEAPIALISEDNNVYRVAKADETNTVTEITTDSTGKFTIKGLDSDTYYLIEKTAPAGYNTLKEAVEIVIANNGKVTYNGTVVDTVKVLNQTGTELPSTGGIGTTIFYVLGGALMAGAFVLLVVRKRMRTE